ncbi:PDZ domain [Trinorchestia longiramus]|nr:PDZ domain [Trinorchestia longiramus]
MDEEVLEYSTCTTTTVSGLPSAQEAILSSTMSVEYHLPLAPHSSLQPTINTVLTRDAGSQSLPYYSKSHTRSHNSKVGDTSSNNSREFGVQINSVGRGMFGSSSETHLNSRPREFVTVVSVGDVIPQVSCGISNEAETCHRSDDFVNSRRFLPETRLSNISDYYQNFQDQESALPTRSRNVINTESDNEAFAQNEKGGSYFVSSSNLGAIGEEERYSNKPMTNRRPTEEENSGKSAKSAFRSDSEKDPKPRTVCEKVVVLRLPGEKLGLGLKFDGGWGCNDLVRRVFIESIAVDSPGSRASLPWGQLCSGDQILNIEGVPVSDMTRLQCVTALRDSHVKVTIGVLKGNGVVPVLDDGPSNLNRSSETNRNERNNLPPPPLPPRCNSGKDPGRPSKDGIFHEVISNSQPIQYFVPDSPAAPMPPAAFVYLDLLAEEEEERRGRCGSESDETGSSASTVVDRLSLSSSTTVSRNSSFNASTDGVRYNKIDLMSALSQFEILEQEFERDPLEPSSSRNSAVNETYPNAAATRGRRHLIRSLSLSPGTYKDQFNKIQRKDDELRRRSKHAIKSLSFSVKRRPFSWTSIRNSDGALKRTNSIGSADSRIEYHTCHEMNSKGEVELTSISATNSSRLEKGFATNSNTGNECRDSVFGNSALHSVQESPAFVGVIDEETFRLNVTCGSSPNVESDVADDHFPTLKSKRRLDYSTTKDIQAKKSVSPTENTVVVSIPTNPDNKYSEKEKSLSAFENFREKGNDSSVNSVSFHSSAFSVLPAEKREGSEIDASSSAVSMEESSETTLDSGGGVTVQNMIACLPQNGRSYEFSPITVNNLNLQTSFSVENDAPPIHANHSSVENKALENVNRPPEDSGDNYSIPKCPITLSHTGPHAGTNYSVYNTERKFEGKSQTSLCEFLATEKSFASSRRKCQLSEKFCEIANDFYKCIDDLNKTSEGEQNINEQAGAVISESISRPQPAHDLTSNRNDSEISNVTSDSEMEISSNVCESTTDSCANQPAIISTMVANDINNISFLPTPIDSGKKCLDSDIQNPDSFSFTDSKIISGSSYMDVAANAAQELKSNSLDFLPPIDAGTENVLTLNLETNPNTSLENELLDESESSKRGVSLPPACHKSKNNEIFLDRTNQSSMGAQLCAMQTTYDCKESSRPAKVFPTNDASVPLSASELSSVWRTNSQFPRTVVLKTASKPSLNSSVSADTKIHTKLQLNRETDRVLNHRDISSNFSTPQSTISYPSVDSNSSQTVSASYNSFHDSCDASKQRAHGDSSDTEHIIDPCKPSQSSAPSRCSDRELDKQAVQNEPALRLSQISRSTRIRQDLSELIRGDLERLRRDLDLPEGFELQVEEDEEVERIMECDSAEEAKRIVAAFTNGNDRYGSRSLPASTSEDNFNTRNQVESSLPEYSAGRVLNSSSNDPNTVAQNTCDVEAVSSSNQCLANPFGGKNFPIVNSSSSLSSTSSILSNASTVSSSFLGSESTFSSTNFVPMVLREASPPRDQFTSEEEWTYEFYEERQCGTIEEESASEDGKNDVPDVLVNTMRSLCKRTIPKDIIVSPPTPDPDSPSSRDLQGFQSATQSSSLLEQGEGTSFQFDKNKHATEKQLNDVSHLHVAHKATSKLCNDTKTSLHHDNCASGYEVPVFSTSSENFTSIDCQNLTAQANASWDPEVTRSENSAGKVQSSLLHNNEQCQTDPSRTFLGRKLNFFNASASTISVSSTKAKEDANAVTNLHEKNDKITEAESSGAPLTEKSGSDERVSSTECISKADEPSCTDGSIRSVVKIASPRDQCSRRHLERKTDKENTFSDAVITLDSKANGSASLNSLMESADIKSDAAFCNSGIVTTSISDSLLTLIGNSVTYGKNLTQSRNLAYSPRSLPVSSSEINIPDDRTSFQSAEMRLLGSEKRFEGLSSRKDFGDDMRKKSGSLGHLRFPDASRKEIFDSTSETLGPHAVQNQGKNIAFVQGSSAAQSKSL